MNTKIIFKLICLLMALSVAFCGCSEKNDSSEGAGNGFSDSTVHNDKNGKSENDDIVDAIKNENNAPSSVFPEIPEMNSDISDGNNDENSNLSDFEACVTESFENFSGTYSYAVHMYDTDNRFSNKSLKMKSASVIKLFIMEYAYSLMVKKEITSDAKIGTQSLLSLIESMIIYSDNDATNTLIDHFTMKKINEFIKSNGYGDTILARKMLDTAAAARGEENYTSSSDVMNFLDKLYKNKASFPYGDMLAIMKRQSISTKIRRDIPAGVEIANKTGELSDVDNDVGIIFTPKGDFAFVCLTAGASPEPARTAIAKSAKALYDCVNR